MDDIKISSETLEAHIRDVRRVCESAKQGLKFKLTKGQFNQEKIESWGYMCDAQGRRVQPKKVDQLEIWPTPEDRASLNSFLCFVNYVQEFMDPEWVKWERQLKDLRKKGCDFTQFQKNAEKFEAFQPQPGLGLASCRLCCRGTA